MVIVTGYHQIGPGSNPSPANFFFYFNELIGRYLETVSCFFVDVSSEEDPQTEEPFFAREISVDIAVESAEHSIH